MKLHFQDWAGHCVEVFFTGIELVFLCIQIPVPTEKAHFSVLQSFSMNSLNKVTKICLN